LAWDYCIAAAVEEEEEEAWVVETRRELSENRN